MVFHLDALGQLPIPLYIQLCLFYAVKDSSSYTLIEKTLKDAVRQLSSNFPWIAGEVVIDGACEGCSGTRKIKLCNSIPVFINDYRANPGLPTMDELRQAEFPLDLLKPNVIAPCNGFIFPKAGTDSLASSNPVFLVQANFIVGGLLLTVAGHHSAMDATGLGEVMRLLSKACHNDPFTSEELSVGNLDRRNIIPIFDESYRPGKELFQQIRPSYQPGHNVRDKGKSTRIKPSQNCSWKCFVFNQNSLDALKLQAYASKLNSANYVSTDDSLTAFIVQAIIRSRLPRLNSTADVTICRIVNARKYLSIPSGYPGFVVNATYYTDTVENLVKDHSGGIASKLRSALIPAELVYRSRALATYISRIRDKSVISFGARINTTEGMVVSSWAKVNCSDLDFNFKLGKPEAVRMPQQVPMEGLIYLLPKGSSGEIAAAICLRDEDMKNLKSDEEFIKYATYSA
ncbi:trichothecene 3-O-acetyltransferase [Schizosaccharomyces japonicus yFS275]|uniref:Trichothecene 3-O-acetyltransferase n=1 Tax=Schizosaccharomyces japonicus (strain yFS275 / FY16936) TaxID=402676 RepID=B6JUW0_SCHJY|nr:trichothecene 3-O-acetyltransferase [Schizosaccharomyces japonicus yFS275]EEB05030.1 trichothecene 3-O-acetyltransferase [Schizosaccharomyces japonicus yFS275]